MSRMSEDRLRNRRLLGLVRQIRRRWRLKVALRGLATLAVAGAAAFLFSAYGLEAFQFTPGSVTAFRVGTYVVLGILALRYLVLPLFRRVSDERVALYLEEHEPELEARVLSALELARSGEEGRDPLPDRAVSPALARGVVESAIERCREIDYGRRIERGSLQRSGGVLAGTAVLSLALFLLGPAYLRHGVTTLLTPTRSAEDVSPYSITVEPGNVTVARGSDQVVRAGLVGFSSDEVDVLRRSGEGSAFQPLPMISDGEGGYEVLLLDLDEPTEYFVRSGGVRSPAYRIDVADLPAVRRLTLEYRFPDYTGLPSRTVENGGDIAAVRGTGVQVTVFPTMGVPGGSLVLDDSTRVPLRLREDGSLTGSLEVSRDGFYHVELDRPGGEAVTASPLYNIDLLSDQRPSVAFTQPGRDTRASAIEELFLEVRADDDYGVGEVVLAYAVNGGEEQRVRLFREGREPMREVSAGHTLFLEEFDLEPGDIVSYWAEVEDNAPAGERDRVTSDIYFLDIRPFGQDFRQADNMGGPGQAQGAGGPEAQLSRRQKEIVAGSFNLQRDRDRYSEDEFRSNVNLLLTSQGQLREQVAGLLQQMGLRGQTEEFGVVTEALRQAGEAMEEAEGRLRERDVEGALAPEQRALQQLLRAEAAFREVQVGVGQGGGGGGGGAAEDLVDLYELELDKLRNQYETVQRGRQEEVDDRIDEARERLKGLARRQQQELERQRRRAENLPGSQSGGGGGQRQLADETEEAARQLERLARESRDQGLMETARELREAADAMRRSAATPGDQGTGQAGQALDRLEEARRRLNRARGERIEGQMDDALRRARELAERQREMAEDVRNLQAGSAGRGEELRRILERKEQMERELGDLEADLDELSSEAGSDQRAAAEGLREAARGIRDEKVKEKLRYSRALVTGRDPDFAAEFEDQIRSDLERLEERLRDAREAVGESEGDRSAQALDRARDLLRGMESLSRRMEEAAEGSEEGRGGEPEGGSPEGRTGEAGDESDREGEVGGRGEARRLDGPRGAPGGGGSLGGFTPDDVRQFRREARERSSEARDLQRELEEMGMEAGDLSRIIGAMEALDRQDLYADTDDVERLRREIVEELRRFEYLLRRQVDDTGSQRLFLSGSDDVPEGFRELVEEYYRALAREDGGN